MDPTGTSGIDPATEAGSQSGREGLVTEAFVMLADSLVDDYDIIDLLDRLVGYSVALLAAQAAGLMLADAHGRLHVVAASNEAAELMDLMQLQADQGPCMDCFASGTPVSIPELANADFHAGGSAQG